jgi:hypothetical protein
MAGIWELSNIIIIKLKTRSLAQRLPGILPGTSVAAHMDLSHRCARALVPLPVTAMCIPTTPVIIWTSVPVRLVLNSSIVFVFCGISSIETTRLVVQYPSRPLHAETCISLFRHYNLHGSVALIYVYRALNLIFLEFLLPFSRIVNEWQSITAIVRREPRINGNFIEPTLLFDLGPQMPSSGCCV